MSAPYWVQDAIFYQIFPDRFANGDPSNDPPNVQPWGSPPSIWGYQGGDLRGIIEHFDYLLDLGVSAIYLNPIFQSSSTHRYNTTDYFRIDPMLGTLNDFRAILDVAHRNSVRVILDGVFNHTGRGFFAFNDILENQEYSPYRDWFTVQRFPPDAYSPGNSDTYLAWWGHKSLPKFNTQNPVVRRYIYSVARYWIEQGADGWRLDVPNEIDDDDFWAEFRQVVKSVNPDAYLLGEIWNVDPRWVGNSHFDGLMDYPLRDALLRWLYAGTYTASEFAARLEDLLHVYPRDNVFAMYLPLGSHDTERLLTKLEGDLNKVKLAFLTQFSLPGAPAIYYGDEIGLTGGKDPECRGAFTWDPKQWNNELRSWVKSLVSARKRFACLRRGDYRQVLVDNHRNCYAFARTLGDEQILVALNASSLPRHLRIPVGNLGWEDGRILHNRLGHAEYLVSGDTLVVDLPACSGAWVG
ncbi:MAG TPA: glycoside hydrolase family 13 protein [Anaerolineales bacterium]